MSIGPTGENLIFLISQPRAGSTLLQRILGSHAAVHTLAEPWVMLQGAYGLKDTGYSANYTVSAERQAVGEFLQGLPEDAYIAGLRQLYTHLYNAALASTDKACFLDKTPRYYLIIPELQRIFPQAKFVILLRNPLAVACSIANAWKRDNWFRLHRYEQDLVAAPRYLIEGIESLGDRAQVVTYEQLTTSPAETVESLCAALSLPFSPDLLQYQTQSAPQSGYGYKDQGSVFRQGTPSQQNLDKWTQNLSDPQYWRVIQDYLTLLGPDTLAQMGYDFDGLQRTVDEFRPPKLQQMGTIPLSWLLKTRETRRSWEYEQAVVNVIRAFQRRGAGGALVRLLQKYTLTTWTTP